VSAFGLPIQHKNDANDKAKGEHAGQQ
jgi:hypothetical protein